MSQEPERWAVVTGSSSGIGRATALLLADQGWHLVLHYRAARERAEVVARSIREKGRSATALQADFADPVQRARFVDQAWSAASGPIEGWAHLAGVDLLTGPEAKWPFAKKLALAIEVDLIGTIDVCRSVAERMRRQNAGSIVTIGWDQSATGMDGDSGQMFAATKGGVAAFTRSLARSIAPNLRANCVAPGWIRTAWGETASDVWQERVVRETPMRRWGEPEEVAAAIAFLLSDAARFITAQTVLVNGGAVAS